VTPPDLTADETRTLIDYARRKSICVLLVAVLAAAAPSAHSKEIDNRTITCREFLVSGQANMAALISWLRGYHAGKTGGVPYQAPDAYGGRLGFKFRAKRASLAQAHLYRAASSSRAK
jgi:hypothetical protein